MGNNREKGQISVFLIIVLLSIILLVGAVVDISRIATGEKLAKSAANCAVRSALTEYNSRLKEEYGIFALKKDNIELNHIIKTYLKKNLIVEQYDTYEDAVYLDLYDFRVEDVNVTALFNLTENEVVRNQILEYMKYRAPKKLIENIWDKLSAVKGVSKVSETYRKKVIVDKLLSNMGKIQEILKRSIDGNTGDGMLEQFPVNHFNKDGARDIIVKRLSELVGEYKSLKKKLGLLEKKLDRLKARLRSEEDADRKDALKDSIAKLGENIRRVNDRADQVQDEFNSLKRKLRYNHTEVFIAANSKAINSIKKVVKIGREAEESIYQLEGYIKDNLNEIKSFSNDFVNAVRSDISLQGNLILQGTKATELINDLEENRKCLDRLLINIDEFDRKTLRIEDCTMTKEEIVNLLSEGALQYNNCIVYDYVKFAKTENAKDPRKGFEEEGRDSISLKDSSNKDIKESGIDINSLPSFKKKLSNNFDIEDQEYIDQFNGSEEHDSEADISVEYQGDLGKLQKEIDFSSNSIKFTGNALAFLSVLGNRVGKELIDLGDELYVNEYIIGNFKNSVPVLKNGSDVSKDIDLRGIEKENRDTFFESEVEYILHGNSSENANRLMTQGQILLIRFGMNALHVYTDERKKALANSIATAISGWWTAGAGIPLISNLVMCGWGMGEAAIDLKDLMDGKSVPFFKTKADWKLDIGLRSDRKNKTHSNLLFSYQDYLRLLLLLKSPSEKINRIEDLIQLNISKGRSSFTMSDCNTYLRAEVIVSIKYFFISSLFVPEDKKTSDGRHKFKVLIYEGY